MSRIRGKCGARDGRTFLLFLAGTRDSTAFAVGIIPSIRNNVLMLSSRNSRGRSIIPCGVERMRERTGAEKPRTRHELATQQQDHDESFPFLVCADVLHAPTHLTVCVLPSCRMPGCLRPCPPTISNNLPYLEDIPTTALLRSQDRIGTKTDHPRFIPMRYRVSDVGRPAACL
jgi:hypothetical protein